MLILVRSTIRGAMLACAEGDLRLLMARLQLACLALTGLLIHCSTSPLLHSMFRITSITLLLL